MKAGAAGGIITAMTTKLRVHFDGSVLVPEEPVDLPVGQSVEVLIERANHSHAENGMPATVLGAVRRPPHVSIEDVGELERAISDSRLAISSNQPIDERGE